MNIFLKFENSYKVKKLTVEHSKIVKKKQKNNEEKEHSKKEASILHYARCTY